MTALVKLSRRQEVVSCECGCGETFELYDRFRRPRRFKMGHAGKMGVSTERKSQKLYMTLVRAREIAGALGKTRKMPGYSYGLDAFQCLVGSKLAKIEGSTCEKCFARKDLYIWKGVREAHAFRMKAIKHPYWLEAMVELISHHCMDEPWFRWHDSGDIMSPEHLHRIIEVCRLTPKVKHWLPTRELVFVTKAMALRTLPPNLTIRLSAYYIGEPAVTFRGLPTSTVHREHGNPVRLEKRNHSIECRAYTRGNQCGGCRACWDGRVQNVSYCEH